MTGVYITAMICGTFIVLALIAKSGKKEDKQ